MKKRLVRGTFTSLLIIIFVAICGMCFFACGSSDMSDEDVINLYNALSTTSMYDGSYTVDLLLNETEEDVTSYYISSESDIYDSHVSFNPDTGYLILTNTETNIYNGLTSVSETTVSHWVPDESGKFTWYAYSSSTGKKTKSTVASSNSYYKSFSDFVFVTDVDYFFGNTAWTTKSDMAYDLVSIRIENLDESSETLSMEKSKKKGDTVYSISYTSHTESVTSSSYYTVDKTKNIEFSVNKDGYVTEISNLSIVDGNSNFGGVVLNYKTTDSNLCTINYSFDEGMVLSETEMAEYV